MWKQIDILERILERLSFNSNSAYSGVEAAIHVARYALARDLCQGKRVLDIACGEGYGSQLLLEWGAMEVVGVDVSEDAIASARKNFSKPGIRYLCSDAQNIDQILGDEKFDLIVSFETIEHLQRPDEYLSSIARMRSPNACVLITCPNDWWYYPKESDGNIYHVRKYTYGEFIDLVTAGLGSPDIVGIGAPCLGFANFTLSWFQYHTDKMLQTEMVNCADHGGLLALPQETGSVSVKNCSYFVAAWGGDSERLAGAAMLPISMDLFSSGFWQASLAAQNGSAEKDELQLKLRSAESKLESAVKEIAKLSSLANASVEETDAMKTLAERLEDQCLLTQKYRNQANALFRETTLLQQSLAEKDQSLAEKDQSLAEKDQSLAEKDQRIGEQEIYLSALLKRWRIVTAIPRKILPTWLVAGVKKFVRNRKS